MQEQDRADARRQMEAHEYAIKAALTDRANGAGLKARMSDERFTRYVLSQLAKFNAMRSEARGEE